MGKGEDSQYSTVQQQERRWSKVLEQWSAQSQHECIIIGDTNLDALKWQDPDQNNTKMVDITKAEIETLDFCQLVRGPTRFWPGKAPSLVDQIWTNQPTRIVSVENIQWGASDHNIIRTTVRTKKPAIIVHNRMKCCRKNFNVDNYRQLLRNTDWSNLYQENNIDVANSIVQEKILESLNTEAPLKCIMERKNYRSWLQPETNDAEGQRHS